ncbi:hypothetical protein BFP97_16425 [Roseivirga sp. 4D4]|nr:hypothetical protein BFP97_16425 [Roseivirga sp. 4D4]
MGGAIRELTLSIDGITKTVISPQEGYHYQSSLLFPFPNRLASGSFEFEGKNYQFPLNDFGLPNALHGMLHDRTFEVKSLGDSHIELVHIYKGELPYYPFPCEINLRYELISGGLSVKVTILNTGSSALPCVFGWHPYFNLPDDNELGSLHMHGVDLIEVDEHMIPTGKMTPYRTLEEGAEISELKLDNCFKFVKKEDRNYTHLIYPDKSLLEVWQDDQHPYVQVFTPDDRRTIAIEPMTGNINALNTKEGLSLVEPQQSLVLCFGVSLSAPK